MKSWVVVALVGCGAAKSPAPVVAPPPVPTPLEPAPVTTYVRDPHSIIDQKPAAPLTPAYRTPLTWPLPPAIDLQEPNVEEYGRWPLTVAEHPALEPHFPIASALADAGVTWTELCARGAQHRHLSSNQELVDYLGAWCDVARRDYESAIEKLGSVRRSTTRGLAHAVMFDVAAITTAHGDSRDLEGFLRRGGFLTLDVVDLVAAAYFEIGQLPDALASNKLATQMDYAPNETARCTRLLREIADTDPAARQELVDALSRTAHPKDDAHAPRCAHEDAMVQCWRAHECLAFWHIDNDLTRVLVGRLSSVRKSWSEITDGADWDRYVDLLIKSTPPRDKYALLLPAAELAVRASDCDAPTLSRLIASLERADTFLAPMTKPLDSFDAQLHDLEEKRLSKVERAAVRVRLHRAHDEAIAIAKLASDHPACLAAIAALPKMVP